MKIRLIIAALLFGGTLNAQVTHGTLKGKLVNEEQASIPAAKVVLEGQGVTLRMLADMDGGFKFSALTPGLYTLKSWAMGTDTTAISSIQIKPDNISMLGSVELRLSTLMGKMFELVHTEPLVSSEPSKIQIGIGDIKHSGNIQNPKELFASMNSDIIIPEGSSEMIIRGSRPGDVIYYVDGVKSDDLNGVPGVGIGSMMGYTGGVPAKYGDTTGGVVILETKSYFDLYYAWKAR
jgi:Carboxypeptidase regulatory-like domain